MGSGERQTPTMGQGVENILGRTARRAAQPIHKFAHYSLQLKPGSNRFTIYYSPPDADEPSFFHSSMNQQYTQASPTVTRSLNGERNPHRIGLVCW